MERVWAGEPPFDDLLGGRPASGAARRPAALLGSAGAEGDRPVRGLGRGHLRVRPRSAGRGPPRHVRPHRGGVDRGRTGRAAPPRDLVLVRAGRRSGRSAARLRPPLPRHLRRRGGDDDGRPVHRVVRRGRAARPWPGSRTPAATSCCSSRPAPIPTRSTASPRSSSDDFLSRQRLPVDRRRPERTGSARGLGSVRPRRCRRGCGPARPAGRPGCCARRRRRR